MFSRRNLGTKFVDCNSLGCFLNSLRLGIKSQTVEFVDISQRRELCNPNVCLIEIIPEAIKYSGNVHTVPKNFVPTLILWKSTSMTLANSLPFTCDCSLNLTLQNQTAPWRILSCTVVRFGEPSTVFIFMFHYQSAWSLESGSLMFCCSQHV